MAFNEIPQELKDRNQWIVWKIIQRDGREIKIPYQIDGRPAKTDDPTTWSSFDECVKVVHNFKGLGYVFSAGDPYTGIDLDSCLDPDTGSISEWAKPWLNKLNSYSEVSPSGTGIKVWVRGKFPFGNGKNVKLPQHPAINGKTAGVEAYDHKRYFAVTGKRVKNLPAACEDRQGELNEFYDHFFKIDSPGKGLIVSKPTPLSVIERARRYLDRVPGAISGQAGHNQTFKAACVLVHGFNLGQTEALILLSEWNQTCEPPWTEKELVHKVESADKQEGDRPRGYLIKTKDEEWERYELPQYVEIVSTKPALIVDNTKLKLTEDEMERLAILEEGSSNGHAFMQNAEGMYRLSIPEYHIIVEIDRLRRESNELIGELVVKCGMPGVRSFEGALAVGDLNVSSVRARLDRAKYLATRTNFGAKEEHIDWISIVEEFCQRVIMDERKGSAAVDLRALDLTDSSGIIKLPGLILPLRHPTIVFGDGGSAKSYMSLYFAGQMAKMGIKVALFDWELAGEDHRERLELLFPDGMPEIVYARCERALIHEVDRLRRIVKDQGVEYCFYDSVAFACSGPPESAEIAGAYYRAVRQIGGGSLHVAHVSKADGADQKPFGSAFWHNGARATWYIKAIEDNSNDKILQLGMFNRKANLARIQKPVGFRIEFNDWQTIVTPDNVANVPELAEKMTLSMRMREVLKKGEMTAEEIASATGAPVKQINRTATRNVKLFLVEGGKIANLYRG
jgi:hypothetical protein